MHSLAMEPTIVSLVNRYDVCTANVNLNKAGETWVEIEITGNFDTSF